jgi:hypothetical protein
LKDSHGTTTLEIGEEFPPGELWLDIETKEAIAVVRVLQGIEEDRGAAFLSGRRLNLWIDNLALVFVMVNGASKNVTTHAQIEILFWMKMRLHFATNPIWWNTKDNWEADGITRVERDDDWRLQRPVFLSLWHELGPFDMDVMASSVSRHCCPKGIGLPFFSRFFSPGNAGVDVLAQSLPPGTYFCFPHHRMVKTVVNHMASFANVRVVLIAQLKDTSWLPRCGGAVQRHFTLPSGAVTKADLSEMSDGVAFGCWVLQFP